MTNIILLRALEQSLAILILDGRDDAGGLADHLCTLEETARRIRLCKTDYCNILAKLQRPGRLSAREEMTVLARSWLKGDMSLGVELGAARAVPDR